jgi:hypothetical protein
MIAAYSLGALLMTVSCDACPFAVPTGRRARGGGRAGGAAAPRAPPRLCVAGRRARRRRRAAAAAAHAPRDLAIRRRPASLDAGRPACLAPPTPPHGTHFAARCVHGDAAATRFQWAIFSRHIITTVLLWRA